MIWASFSLWIAIATRRGGKKLSHNFIKLKWRDHNNTRPARRLLKINLICQRQEEVVIHQPTVMTIMCARFFFSRSLLDFIWNIPTVDSLGRLGKSCSWMVMHSEGGFIHHQRDLQEMFELEIPAKRFIFRISWHIFPGDFNSTIFTLYITQSIHRKLTNCMEIAHNARLHRSSAKIRKVKTFRPSLSISRTNGRTNAC